MQFRKLLALIFSASFAEVSSCLIIGDPHYRTFDRAMIHVQHNCKADMVESVASELPYFAVRSRHEHRHGNINVSYPMYIEVTTNGHDIRLGKEDTVTASTTIFTAGSGRIL